MIYRTDGSIRGIYDGEQYGVEAQLQTGEGFIQGNARPGIDRVENGKVVVCEIPDFVLDRDAKSMRNRLLVLSDWTQLPDVPLTTKEAWAVYRQALRDVTEQPGYPADVDWPVAP